jgi:PTH1 family peptidyl-tRNA hydrolase
VVGLGNPGSEFVGTLHNVGADAVEMVAQRAAATLRAEKGVQARVATRFGIAEPASIVVVHDELDLPPGTVRVKAGGGLAGHNGLRSLESHLHSSDFVRVRIGVGKPPSARQGAAHVLNRPPKAVRSLLDAAVETAAETVERIARDGVEGAMQWCHSLP